MLVQTMTILYNCKHSGDQYRITKFNDGQPESSYLTTLTECDCPAGVRPMCRHREMLPHFLHRNFVNTGWQYDYDRGGWVDMRQDDEIDYGDDGPKTEPRWSTDEEMLNELFPKPHSTTVSAPDFESEDISSNPVGVATAPARQVPYRKPNDGRRV